MSRQFARARIPSAYARHQTARTDGLREGGSAATGNTPVGGDRPAGRESGGWDGSLSGGIVAELDDGASIDTAAPGRPNLAFDPFVLAMLRQIGRAHV